MTEEEFYAEFEKLLAGGWSAELCSPISALRVSYIRLVPPWITIPCSARPGLTEDHYCPITAVYQSFRTQFVHPREYQRAAHLLGLSDEFRERVMRAADGYNDRDPATRSHLLTALGLVECRGES